MKNDHPEQLPLARTDQLIVKEVDGELLVYDLKTDQAHCLNKTAAIVWKNCDGGKSIAEIKESLGATSAVPVDDAVIWMALDELEKFKLMAQVPTQAHIFVGISRRQLMRSIGLTAVALPLVTSILAPTAVSATSVCNAACGPGNPCTNPACNNCTGSPKRCT